MEEKVLSFVVKNHLEFFPITDGGTVGIHGIAALLFSRGRLLRISFYIVPIVFGRAMGKCRSTKGLQSQIGKVKQGCALVYFTVRRFI